MDLKNISSLAELREQRKKLAVEQRIAIDGVKQNYRTEKRRVTNQVKAEANKVRYLIDDGVDGIQALLHAGTASVQSLFAAPEAVEAPQLRSDSGLAAEKTAHFWEDWKLPALGGIAGIFGMLLTFWLTGDDEDEEVETESSDLADEERQYRPTEADEFGDLPDYDGPQPTGYRDTPYEEFDRNLNLEQQIHAALASYKEDQQEKTQKSTFITVMGVVLPVLLRELMRGGLGDKVKEMILGVGDGENSGDNNPMQDVSNSIADELEKVKASVMVKESAA